MNSSRTRIHFGCTFARIEMPSYTAESRVTKHRTRLAGMFRSSRMLIKGEYRGGDFFCPRRQTVARAEMFSLHVHGIIYNPCAPGAPRCLLSYRENSRLNSANPMLIQCNGQLLQSTMDFMRVLRPPSIRGRSREPLIAPHECVFLGFRWMAGWTREREMTERREKGLPICRLPFCNAS